MMTNRENPTFIKLGNEAGYSIKKRRSDEQRFLPIMASNRRLDKIENNFSPVILQNFLLKNPD